MAVAITHAKVAGGVDDPTKEVSKDAWNDDHAIVGLGTAAEADVSDFEPAGVSAADITDSTATGRAVLTAADAAAARTAIGAGTSSFSGAYGDLSGTPTLGALAALNTAGTSDIDNDAVTYAKIQNVTDNRLLGRSAGSSGDVQEITVGSGLSLAAGSLTATGGGVSMGDVYPVGHVYISVVSTNPGTLLGVGTWAALGAGRVLVGIDSGDTDFDTAEETGGVKTVTLTAAQSGLPQHTHTQDSHNHTQDSHNHTQNPHSHGMAEGQTDGAGTFMDRSNAASATTTTTDAATATNQATTATNQAATATNQAATATNQDAGPTNASAAHTNLMPYLVVYMWKRTA